MRLQELFTFLIISEDLDTDGCDYKMTNYSQKLKEDECLPIWWDWMIEQGKAPGYERMQDTTNKYILNLGDVSFFVKRMGINGDVIKLF